MIRRLLVRLLLLLLLAWGGFNWWQVRLLRREVGRLQRQVAVLSRQPDQGGPAGKDRRLAIRREPAPDEWLDRADWHLRRARAAAARTDFSLAQRELSRSVGALHSALAGPEAGTRAGLDRIRRQLVVLQAEADDVRGRMDALWRSRPDLNVRHAHGKF